MQIAQTILARPKMTNHNRGLWGYTGKTADGMHLTVQSTGIGGPSVALVVEELAQLGVKRAIRIGTCGALSEKIGLQELIVATEAIAADGASQALGADRKVGADKKLSEALNVAAPQATAGLIVTTDLFYEPKPERNEGWAAEGALAVEMEAAALFTVAQQRGVRAACLLAVTDLLSGRQRERLEDEKIRQLGPALGEIALAALTSEC